MQLSPHFTLAEMTVSQEEDCQLADLLADEDAPAPVEAVLRRQASERLRDPLRVV